ncbi:oligopeptide transporter substrate-binding protein [Mycobacterium malmoense]|uniref:Uncharacterized protein n=1 Tax=Mycobacterium malmoense TaxID=1780 RepID=A0ABX3SLT2_MYCMA|nr:hypothetical protein [Mycobacterium malmoense]ORA78494.1 hypothetical protein BST29_21310 [Mycobacterium malmoense]QZA18143.1 oligopeptide transporter substrate-binding protein [Mycobacterium malmoense]UNB94917.1 oligopeptide transporter substrate-binding protein [Mycobacterium malmoense]
MARREPPLYGAGDTIVQDDYGHVDNGVDAADQEPVSDGPIPGWRKPIALVGWGLLIAILIALIVWGIAQLVQSAPPQEPATTTTTTTTTTPPSSAAPVVPPTRHQHEETTTPDTDIPTASTKNTATPTTSAPSHGTFPFPQLPSVITLPSLPGLPTEITLPPGL